MKTVFAYVPCAMTALLSACGSEATTDFTSLDRVADAGSRPTDAEPAVADAMVVDATPSSVDAGPPIDAGAPPSAPFSFITTGPATCPLTPAECAASWPATGTVTRWTSLERFGDVEHERTAWLYRPPGTEGRALPLFIFLHGGNGDGPSQLARQFDELARAEAVTWRRGSPQCTFTYPEGFRRADGRRRVPPEVSYRATEPFALLLPDGIPSRSTRIPGARHWEDGRSPSPGQLVTEQTRDDVGFIAHLIDVAATEAGGDLDPTRIYLGGWSNGGMMTQRVVCEMGRSGRRSLQKIAAVVVGIAALPANLFDGAAGRPRCPTSGFEPPPMLFQVGRGIDTPDCEQYPCTSPVADGDGLMPFGRAGDRHRVFSPDGGFVQSFADTWTRFRSALDAAYGADRPDVTTPVGQFTEQTVATFDGDRVELRALVTDGGAHQVGGARAEFASEGQQWAFLSSFERVDGQIRRRARAAVEGEF